MSIFNINYPVFVNYLLPLRKRKLIRIAWINCLISPVVYLYTLFMDKRTSQLYYLSHTSQVAYMQAVLNDVFDAVLTRIMITDNINTSPVYTYLDPEIKPVYLFLNSESQPVYLWADIEANTGSNFIVHVPSALSFDMARMNALINLYKLPSITYKVVTI